MGIWLATCLFFRGTSHFERRHVLGVSYSLYVPIHFVSRLRLLSYHRCIRAADVQDNLLFTVVSLYQQMSQNQERYTTSLSSSHHHNNHLATVIVSFDSPIHQLLD